MLRNRDLVPNRPNRRSRKAIFALIFLGLGGAWSLSQVIRSRLFFPLIIPSDTNSPALPVGEKFFIDRRVTPDEIHYDDLLLFHHPRTPEYSIIRRVVGFPGDTIQIKNGALLRNGSRVNTVFESNIQKIEAMENGIPEAEIFPLGNTIAITLGKNQFYLLADHPEKAIDSRLLGPISAEYLIGRVDRFGAILLRHTIIIKDKIISIFPLRNNAKK